MPTIHVCPLSRLSATVCATGASHIVTLINLDTLVERPPSITADCHLLINVSDIIEPMDGHILPGEEHVSALIDFVRLWPAQRPLVIHCYAGISRSTAAALIAACALRPERDELELALRLRAASPTATPNGRLIYTADQLLRRDGRLLAAAEAIGRGKDAFEGEPFALHLD